MRVKITDIGTGDAFYRDRYKLIGLEANINGIPEKHAEWFSANVSGIKGHDSIGCFAAFKYIEVPEPEYIESLDRLAFSMETSKGSLEPSAMSDVARWIDENKTSLTEAMDKLIKSTKELSDAFYRKSKKLSWLQSLSKYFKYNHKLEKNYLDLQARCNAAEAMRDHYKALMTEALRDRDLHAKVADNWQQKAIEANNETQKVITDYANFLDLMEKELLADPVGKRLKFSVGHNYFEIIVGNPVTVCYFTARDIKGEAFDWFTSVSICHKNDTFSWKRGAVESLKNMVDGWLGTSYGDKQYFYNALFTAYPEIGIKPVEPKKPIKKSKKATK
jgi:hypothetical protein